MGKAKSLALWLITALTLGLLLFVAESSRISLDDVDPAFQRPGFLMNTDTKLPPPIYEPALKHPTLIIFSRSFDSTELFHDLSIQSDLAQLATIVLISQDGSRPMVDNGVKLVLKDEDDQFADSLLGRKPIDDGYPVGYVIADSSSSVRYSTIDPHFSHNGKEIAKILRAVK